MGTYSWYFTTRNDAEGCKIDWLSMDTTILFKSNIFKHCYEMKPENIEQFAEMISERKLIGYFTEELKGAFLEFNRHLVPYGSFPRIYYTYEGSDNLYSFEFIPGTYNLILGMHESTEDEDKSILPESLNWRFEQIL